MKTSLVFFLILPQKFSASYFLLSNSVEEVFRLLLQLIPPAVLVHTPFDSFRNFTTSLTSFLFWIFKLSFLPFLPWIFCIWCKQSWIIKTIFYFLNPKEAFQSWFCITFDKIDLLFLSWTFSPLAYFPDSCSLLISHMLLWQILVTILLIPLGINFDTWSLHVCISVMFLTLKKIILWYKKQYIGFLLCF